MTRRAWILITLTLLLATTYVIFFSHWFDGHKIVLIARLGDPPSPRYLAKFIKKKPPPTPAVRPVVFHLDGHYPVTQLQVIALPQKTDDPKDKPEPLWNLVTDGTPPVLETLNYGQALKGLKPAVAGARPQPLKPDVPYRLILHVGGQTAQVDFSTKKYDPPAKS